MRSTVLLKSLFLKAEANQLAVVSGLDAREWQMSARCTFWSEQRRCRTGSLRANGRQARWKTQLAKNYVQKSRGLGPEKLTRTKVLVYKQTWLVRECSECKNIAGIEGLAEQATEVL